MRHATKSHACVDRPLEWIPSRMDRGIKTDQVLQRYTYSNKTARQLEQFVAFLVHKQFTVDTLEALSTETPDTVRTVCTERPLKHTTPAIHQVQASSLTFHIRCVYAVIATKPVHRLQIGPMVHNWGTPRTPKLHLVRCSSAGMRRGTDRNIDRRPWPTFCLAMPNAKCNNIVITHNKLLVMLA